MYFKPTQVWYKWYKACAQSRTCACKTSSGLVRRWCYGYRGRSSRMSHSSLFWLHCIIKSSLFCFSFLLKALFLKVAKTAAAYLVTETSLKTEQEIKCIVDRTICVLSKMVKKKTTHCTGHTSPYKYDRSWVFFVYTFWCMIERVLLSNAYLCTPIMLTTQLAVNIIIFIFLVLSGVAPFLWHSHKM